VGKQGLYALGVSLETLRGWGWREIDFSPRLGVRDEVFGYDLVVTPEILEHIAAMMRATSETGIDLRRLILLARLCCSKPKS